MGTVSDDIRKWLDEREKVVTTVVFIFIAIGLFVFALLFLALFILLLAVF
mgnify:CR=1 FL=1